MCQYQEARKRSNQRVMLSQTWQESFGNSFEELRKAIFNRDAEAVAELIADLENAACDLVQDVEETWQRTGA